jgi:hypothetical protein
LYSDLGFDVPDNTFAVEKFARGNVHDRSLTRHRASPPLAPRSFISLKPVTVRPASVGPEDNYN